MSDLIPESFEDLEELREFCIINDEEYNRLFKILLDQLLPQSTQSLTKFGIPQSQLTQLKNKNPKELGQQEIQFKEGTTETTDKDGIITRIKQYVDEDGQKIRVVTKLRRIKRIVRLPVRVIKRRNLAKFGRCKDNPFGPEPGVTSLGDQVYLKLASEEEKEKETSKKQAIHIQGSTITCRNCDEPGHWTMHCPRKNTKHSESTSESTLHPLHSLLDESETSGKYVPPSRRKDRPRFDVNIKETKTNIKVSNLDEKATDDDLKQLFGNFGQLKRARVITDRTTHLSRGFAFVEYEDEDGAQKAMDTLQRYAYGQQILELAWAKPRRR